VFTEGETTGLSYWADGLPTVLRQPVIPEGHATDEVPGFQTPYGKKLGHRGSSDSLRGSALGESGW
jgi:hypothetical protein